MKTKQMMRCKWQSAAVYELVSPFPSSRSISLSFTPFAPSMYPARVGLTVQYVRSRDRSPSL